MIRVRLTRKGKHYDGLTVRGHADFADPGEDIVCAAVTSVVQYLANALTEVLKLRCKVTAGEDIITIAMDGYENMQSDSFFEAFRLHLTMLSEDYPKTIELSVQE